MLRISCIVIDKKLNYQKSHDDMFLGLFIKDTRRKGGGYLSILDILRTRGGRFFRCGFWSFYFEKLKIFQKFWVSARTRMDSR